MPLHFITNIEFPCVICVEKCAFIERDGNSASRRVVIARCNGVYEICSNEEWPNQSDTQIFLYLLRRFYQKKEAILTTSMSDVAAHTFLPPFTTHAYIFAALMRWKAICICFEDRCSITYYAILDQVLYNEQTGDVEIRFNEQYIRQLNCIPQANFWEYDLSSSIPLR